MALNLDVAEEPSPVVPLLWWTSSGSKRLPDISMCMMLQVSPNAQNQDKKAPLSAEEQKEFQKLQGSRFGVSRHH